MTAQDTTRRRSLGSVIGQMTKTAIFGSHNVSILG